MTETGGTIGGPIHKVSPGPKLTREEVAAYVPKIEQGLTMPEPDRSEFLARVRAWGEADDGGPVYLANISHFNERRHVTYAKAHRKGP